MKKLLLFLTTIALTLFLFSPSGKTVSLEEIKPMQSKTQHTQALYDGAIPRSKVQATIHAYESPSSEVLRVRLKVPKSKSANVSFLAKEGNKPNRVVADFHGVSHLEKTASMHFNHSSISNIRVGSWKAGVTRVVFDLEDGVQLTPETVDKDGHIKFSLFSRF